MQGDRRPPMRHLARSFVALAAVLALATNAFADSGPSDYQKLDGARQGHYVHAGQSGAVVAALQNALSGSCFAVVPTGSFDAATTAALVSFQKAHGCTP